MGGTRSGANFHAARSPATAATTSVIRIAKARQRRSPRRAAATCRTASSVLRVASGIGTIAAGGAGGTAGAMAAGSTTAAGAGVACQAGAGVTSKVAVAVSETADTLSSGPGFAAASTSAAGADSGADPETASAVVSGTGASVAVSYTHLTLPTILRV